MNSPKRFNDDDDYMPGKLILALFKLGALLIRAFQSPVTKLISKLLARR